MDLIMEDLKMIIINIYQFYLSMKTFINFIIIRDKRQISNESIYYQEHEHSNLITSNLMLKEK